MTSIDANSSPAARQVLRELHPLVKRIFVGVAFSALGNGLTMPFLFIYLTDARHFDKSVVGLVISWIGLLGFLLTPAAGTLIDRFGPRPVMIAGLVVEASCVAALAFVETVPQGWLVASLMVLGSVGLWPAATAMMTRLIPVEHRETVYGFQFMLMNAGLGVGGLISSLLLTSTSVESFQRLYFLNAGAYLAYIVVAISLPRGTGAAEAATPQEGVTTAEAGWREVLADRSTLKVVGTMIVVLVFGYAQFEVGFPAYATGVAGVPADRLGWAFACNTAVIVLGQLAALRWIRGRRRSRLLATTALVWSLAWAVIASSALVPGWGAVVAVVVGLGVFGLGETLWAPVAPALINDLAREELRGRYNALQGMTWTVATILGPALAGLLMGHDLPGVWVTLTVGGSAVGALLLARLSRHLTPAQDGLVTPGQPS